MVISYYAVSVSYTHLDVYKRQVIILYMFSTVLAAVIAVFASMASVSYTHLDVYKRQEIVLAELSVFRHKYQILCIHDRRICETHGKCFFY